MKQSVAIVLVNFGIWLLAIGIKIGNNIRKVCRRRRATFAKQQTKDMSSMRLWCAMRVLHQIQRNRWAICWLLPIHQAWVSSLR